MADIRKQGKLSIDSENIFPIIKKWLYSDHDIFYRELVSNGCDAITKLKKLELMGEAVLADDYKGRVDVEVSALNRTITITDNGLGMTAAEVEEYINQIAFSGAKDFLETYKDKTNEDQIIGHFGLGFYSAFMVSDRVTIETKSWKDEPAVFWESEGGQEFEMTESDRTKVGTTITLYVNEDSVEFTNEYRAKEVLQKYCAFMPVEIFLKNADQGIKKDSSEPQTYEEMEQELFDNIDAKQKAEEEEKPLNETNPLWNQTPSGIEDEDYKKFYRTTFNDYKEPIFWIHLNMDYPFRLKGILYFPRITNEYENVEGTIKLFNNQVFVADNIKEVIPEYLLILKGVIDCPDLPLNVSRSALQNDGFVKKISDYITKKVADKLSGMCKTDRENYEKYWDDIAPFVKYGYIRDEKFRDRIGDYVLLKNLKDEYKTLKELIPAADVEVVEADGEAAPVENNIFYVNNAKNQAQYIRMFKEADKEAVYLNTVIDPNYIQMMEQAHEGLHFVGIDSAPDDDFVEELDTEDEGYKADVEKLTEAFKAALDKEVLDVSVQKLKDASIAAMISKSEDARRLDEMMRRYGQHQDMGDYGQTLILNLNHPLVQHIIDNPGNDDTAMFCEQLYDLALMVYGPLPEERMNDFIQRSNKIMMELAKQ